jgi:DNA-directed RNA polymerase subunit RPC12/RpoP
MVFEPMPEMQDVRCPKCKKLLFRVCGISAIEIICPRCGSKILWHSVPVTDLIFEKETHDSITVDDPARG